MLVPAIAAAVGGYVALVGLSRVSYRKLLYPAPKRAFAELPGATLERFEAADGMPVEAARYRSSAEAGRTAVFFHGNAETIADSVERAHALLGHGLSVVTVEYRGYGSSPGRSPSEAGLYADAEAVLRALHAEGIGPDRITLWGNSLGTGVATEMAFRGHGSRLILQAPFTSIPDVAMTVAPFLPLRAIMKDRFASLEKAPFIQLPTLIVHGDADGVVPYRMGRRLSERFAHATLHTVPGGGHSDLYLRDPTLLDRIAAFAAATDG